MKLKCIKNWIWNTNRDSTDLSEYITIGKIYYLSGNPPCSEWVYNIIDDRGRPHDMGKDMFIDLAIDREEKLNQLGI